MRLSIRLIAASGLACAMGLAFGATPGVGPQSPLDLAPASNPQVALRAGDGTATSQGGTLKLRFNTLLQDLGLGRVEGAQRSSDPLRPGFVLELSPRSTFDLHGTEDSVHAVVGGSGSLDGQLRLTGGRAAIDFDGMRYVVRGHAVSPRIDFIGRDGRVLFYADSLMFEWIDGGATFNIRSADLSVSAHLAELLGQPLAADARIAELHLEAPLRTRALGAVPKGAGTPNFHGEAVPGVPGETYQVDVFMQAYSMSYQGCNDCAGPDGQIKFVPSSTLVNNLNNGTFVQTVNDPMGTSTARYTGDVPWYRKFTTSPWAFPYPGNDQHPYLIWNLYRIGADGSLVQIGRSSVKHAFLTVNSGNCAPGLGGNNVLRRGCADTYGIGNNDAPQDLGPRSEIIPATGQFGRCGSIFDTNCDAVQNTVSSGQFDRRMLVRESAVDPVLNPGATLLTESWYIVQDDINVYNTMATRPFTTTPSGTNWTAVNGSPFRLGPAIDRWAESSPAGTQVHRSELTETGEGQAKLVAKAIRLAGGQARYHYALMNVDFSRAVTEGQPPNLRVLRNLGFRSFEVPVFGAISDIRFYDGDDSAANDWTFERIGDRLVWTAPAGNELNWGTLFSFSFEAPSFPSPALATLGVAEPGLPAAHVIPTVMSNSDALLSDSFD